MFTWLTFNHVSENTKSHQSNVIFLNLRYFGNQVKFVKSTSKAVKVFFEIDLTPYWLITL